MTTSQLRAILPDVVPERPVPFDLGAEAALIGALLLNRDTIITVEPLLAGPGDFFREAHAWIYAAILDLYARREPPDMQTLASELDRRGQLAPVGGVAYFAHCMAVCPTAVHAPFYAKRVGESAALRRLITAGGRIAGLGYEEGLDLEEVFTRAERLLLAVTQARRRAPDATDHAALDTYYEGLLARLAGTAPPVGIPTGLDALDDLIHGLTPGTLLVITGESGGGKTTVQSALALAAKAAGRAVGFVSLEMSAAKLAERELAHAARVDSALLAAGHLTAAEQRRVADAFADLIGQVPMRWASGGGATWRDLAGTARRWASEGGLDALFIDYIQRVQLPGRNYVAELDAMMNGMKDLAGELHIPLITASQLSKGAVGKDSAEWDDYMRGSQAIKQAADIIITVAPTEERPRDATRPWRVRLEVTKHRDGPTGAVLVDWYLAYNRIVGVGA